MSGTAVGAGTDVSCASASNSAARGSPSVNVSATRSRTEPPACAQIVLNWPRGAASFLPVLFSQARAAVGAVSRVAGRKAACVATLSLGETGSAADVQPVPASGATQLSATNQS